MPVRFRSGLFHLKSNMVLCRKKINGVDIKFHQPTSHHAQSFILSSSLPHILYLPVLQWIFIHGHNGTPWRHIFWQIPTIYIFFPLFLKATVLTESKLTPRKGQVTFSPQQFFFFDHCIYIEVPGKKNKIICLFRGIKFLSVRNVYWGYSSIFYLSAHSSPNIFICTLLIISNEIAHRMIYRLGFLFMKYQDNY